MSVNQIRLDDINPNSYTSVSVPNKLVLANSEGKLDSSIAGGGE